jgi:hypothetical protein
MALLFKQLKPSTLRQDKMRLALLNGMRVVGRDVRKDYKRTTKTWEHQPEFEIVISLAGGGPTALVATDDEIYRYVDEGTKKHLIWAGIYTGKSDKKTLRFPGTFSAKTIPGVLDSRPGRRGGETVHTPYVQHPGSKARRFTRTIEKIWKPKFKRYMERTMRDVRRASGHAI